MMYAQAPYDPFDFDEVGGIPVDQAWPQVTLMQDPAMRRWYELHPDVNPPSDRPARRRGAQPAPIVPGRHDLSAVANSIKQTTQKCETQIKIAASARFRQTNQTIKPRSKQGRSTNPIRSNEVDNQSRALAAPLQNLERGAR